MCFSSSSGKSNNKASEQASQQARAQEQNFYAQQRADQDRMAAEARQAQIRRQQNIATGLANINKAFSDYNPEYFNNLSRQYETKYTQDLADQKQKADQQALFGLARQGLVGSSAANTAYEDLNKAFGNKTQEIQSAANNYAQGARSQIEAQRSNLISQLNATGGDPVTSGMFTGGGNGSLLGNLAPQAPELPTFSALGDAFTGVTNLLSADSSRAAAYGREGLLPTAFRKFSGRGSDKYIE
jgi:hypothetical protein